MRSIFAYALTVFVAAFLWILVHSPATYAATSATWDGDTIVYDGDKTDPYKKQTANGTTPPSLAQGTVYYLDVDAAIGTGGGTASIIYFGSSDAASATSAKRVVYNINGDGTYSNKISGPDTITVTPKTTAGTSTEATADGAASTETSCAIDGIGWIVCPISNFLAWGMDNIFEMLKGFLVVEPLSKDDALYQAWSYMRTFANVAFVIAFVIIIYSQLTSIGIDNYSVKKLLPRLIITAILVNISFFICSIAVDLSNIAGDSIQQIFVQIRNDLQGPNTNDISSWESVSGFILAGGTATAAAAAGITGLVIASGASAGAAVILLLPMLLSLLIAILVALVVLAARQAVIVVLVIAAPIAFVAYLLPNTEKWFEKWRTTFMTLLVFFPIFALVFGGSQLAGFLIIQNADQINMILLGMFVQVAPLVLTPMLIKFSGSIVGKIAGMVNDPSKGLVDKTRKWSQNQSEYLAKKNMARTDPVRRRQVFRRFALTADQMKRSQEARSKAYQEQTDARWSNSQQYSDIQQQLRYAQDEKGLGEDRANTRYETAKSGGGTTQNLDIRAREAKLQLDNAKLQSDVTWDSNHNPLITQERMRGKVLKDQIAALHSTHDAEYEELKAGRQGNLPRTAEMVALRTQAQDNTTVLAANAMRSQFAKRVQQETLTQDYLLNTRVIDGKVISSYAGGIHAKGAEMVLAQALSEQNKARNESIANANAIIEHLNLSAEETVSIAKNISVKGVIVTDDIKEAAIKRIGSNGVMPHIREVLEHMDLSPTGNEDHRIALVEALRGNSGRQKFLGFGLLDQMTQGFAGAENGVPEKMMDQWIAKMLTDGKLSAKELVSQDRDTLVHINEALGRLTKNPSPQLSAAFVQLKSEIRSAKTDPQLWNAAGERKDVIDDIDNSIFRS